MILVCYDGSADAQAAVDRAGVLMPGAEATVLVIWETVLETMTRNGTLGMGLGMIGGFDDDEKADAAIKQGALDTATEGTQRAAAAGLLAQLRIESRHGDIAAAILTAAADVDADLIVLGTRGLGGVKSMMLGSVSHAVVHHADRAVLVVPSAQLAEQRHRWSDHAHTSAGVA
ncbi:MAG: universal stress protein [Solirubrobacteraceae bacterium]